MQVALFDHDLFLLNVIMQQTHQMWLKDENK